MHRGKGGTQSNLGVCKHTDIRIGEALFDKLIEGPWAHCMTRTYEYRNLRVQQVYRSNYRATQRRQDKSKHHYHLDRRSSATCLNIAQPPCGPTDSVAT